MTEYLAKIMILYYDYYRQTINADDHTDVPLDPSRPLHIGGFNFVSVVLAARILRLLRLPLNLPFVRTISTAIAATLPVIMRCAVLFLAWLYFWVHIAQALFSGPKGSRGEEDFLFTLFYD
jgi:hypothetical protein